jgi:hypothetical protein
MPESQTPPAADLGQLRRLLVQHFSADDLRSLCQDLDVDYDVLPGEGTDAKARELIAFMQRRGRLADLRAAATRERPQVAWGDAGENRDRGQGQSPEIDTEKRTERPAQLASPIVQKLKKSGVQLSQQFSYADNAKADVDFPLPKGKVVSEVIRAMKSHNWGTQSPAVVKLLEADWSKISADEAFVLGRNVYQCACGYERKAFAVLSDLRRELAALPEERALDFLNGMLFEVYFNCAGEFRGRKLKARCLSELLALQTVKKFAPSIAFIRRSLEPYASSVLCMPNTEPEIVSVALMIREADPPTVRSLQVKGRELLASVPEPDELGARLWSLSYQSFTVNELRQQLSEEWGVPPDQLEVKCKLTLDSKVKLRVSTHRVARNAQALVR